MGLETSPDIMSKYAHILFSASLDLMHPLNEQYATDGSIQSNPNEIVSTAVAFVGSIIISFIFYLFLGESSNMHNSFDVAFIKLFCTGLVTFISCLYLFVMKIKAFYYEE